MNAYVNFPVAVYIDEHNISIIENKHESLYKLLHASAVVLDPFLKRAIILKVAVLLNTLHQSKASYGHLTTHNVFVDYPEDAEDLEWTELYERVEIQIGQVQLKDLGRYANMFYEYRVASVWSPPECLKMRKGMLEPTP